MALDLKALKALADQAADIEDQTEVQTSYEYTLPEAGRTVARLAEYVDLGMQKRRPYRGKDKPPADEVRIVFELLHPTKNIRELDDKTKIADRLTVKITKSLSDKAGFKKLFNAMRYGRDGIKHMAQMIGEEFVLNIIHSEPGKNQDGTEKRQYANIKNKDGVWQVESPYNLDAITGKSTKYNVPALIGPVRLFIWDMANGEMWNSLFIDGTREVTAADGTVTEQSKNYIQEKIMEASNFEGSPVSVILGGLTDDLPTEEAGLPEEAAADLADLDARSGDLPLVGDDGEVNQSPETEEDEDDKAIRLLQEKKAAKLVAAAAKAPVAKAAEKPKAAPKATKAATPAAAAPKAAGKAATKAAAVAPAPDSDDALKMLGLL